MSVNAFSVLPVDPLPCLEVDLVPDEEIVYPPPPPSPPSKVTVDSMSYNELALLVDAVVRDDSVRAQQHSGTAIEQPLAAIVDPNPVRPNSVPDPPSSDQQFPLPPVQQAVADDSIPMLSLHPTELAKLEQCTGRKFTLNASGLGEEFCQQPLHGSAHVWLSPTHSSIKQTVEHYFAQKQTCPSVSACILIPHWAINQHHALQSMKIVAQFPKGYHLYVDAQGHKVKGLPGKAIVLYDPPVLAVSSSPLKKQLAMLYKCKVSNAKALCLLDTGAQGSHFISEAFCHRNGLKITPTAASSITMADNSVVSVLGTTQAHVHLQHYHAKLTFLVIPLSHQFDIILGDEWLKTHKAVIDMAHAKCTLVHKGIDIVLQGQSSNPSTGVPSPDPPILSAMQLKRVVRKGANHFSLVMVQEDLIPEPVSVIASLSLSVDDTSSQSVPSPELVPQHALDALLVKYNDVFPPEQPGLPPYRPIPEVIPLEPGSKPTSRTMYRYSIREKEEMKKQLTSLLEKGLIEPSTSPFGAPVLFVDKPDGSKRMVCDYRAINKITLRNKWPLPRIDDLFDQLAGSAVYSTIDLISGYNQLLLDPKTQDAERSTFLTPMGAYKWKVLSFGLTNAPQVFSHVMNNIFRDEIGKFVLIYLDDILIFSKTPDEHLSHIEHVLAKLRANQLYASHKKCVFNQTHVKFLGHIVSGDGIRVDPRKTRIVHDWPVPKNQKDVRSFLGLANYFRRFIQGFSKMVAPLRKLTCSTVTWDWSPICQSSFEDVKHALTHAPVLTHPDFTKPFVVVTDASGDAKGGGLGAVLMQEGKVIAYESRALIPAEVNYSTSEQELLAVVHALKLWRCYLEGVKFTVITDHQPNVALPTQPFLDRRKARWSEILQDYDFTWEYRPGRVNVADPLSRVERTAVQSPLPLSGELMIAAIGGLRTRTFRPPESAVRPTLTGSYLTFIEKLKEGYLVDKWFTNPEHTTCLQQLHGLYYKADRIMVPDMADVKDAIFEHLHAAPYAGHFGVNKTVQAISRRFFWPSLRRDVKSRIKICEACQRNKATNYKPSGKLMPMPIPNSKWESVGIDFVVHLPRTTSGYDAICVFVDRLTKMVHLCPTHNTCDAVDTAQLFVQHVFKLHGLPASFVTDRGTQFTSTFFAKLCSMLQIKQRLSSAFHPQTDGQTERVNRVMQDCLRHYISPSQDDWDVHLPLIEFAINSSKQESTKETPFFLNYGEHPRTPLDLMLPPADSSYAHTTAPGVLKSVRLMQLALSNAKLCLEAAQNRQKAYADKKRSDTPIKLHSDVLLSTQNLKLKSPGSKKLLPKWIGPFNVIKVINNVAFKLALPTTMSKVHPVFHASLLKPYYPSGTCQPPPPIVDEEGDVVYFVESIIDHRIRKSGRKNITEYLIKWKGYSHEHNTWEPVSNIMDHELIQDYEKRQSEIATRASNLAVSKRTRDKQLLPASHESRPRTRRRT